MRLDPLYDDFPETCAERGYLEEVIRRLHAIIGDDLDDATAVALLHYMHAHRIDCADGFVINDERDLRTTLGFHEAAIIAACLSAEPVRDAMWWRHRRFEIAEDAIARAEVRLDRALRAHPSVAGID